MDVKIENGKVLEYRTRLQLSFKSNSRKPSRGRTGCIESSTCPHPNADQE